MRRRMAEWGLVFIFLEGIKKVFRVALSCQNRYAQAVEAYKKALEIDPENESYNQNLSIAEDKLKEAEAAFPNNPVSIFWIESIEVDSTVRRRRAPPPPLVDSKMFYWNFQLIIY